MKSLFLILLVVLPYHTAGAASSALPKDVSTFLEQRESCDHWRGEYGYDEERQADINWAICQSCSGTDSKLASLKKKYRANARIMKKLNELDEKIEPKDKADTKRFCLGTRKPEWMK